MGVEQPTIWGWIVFWVSIGLTLYAFVHLASGLLSRGRPPAPAQAAERPGQAYDRLPWPLRALAWIGRVSIAYLYLPFWRFALLLWEVPGILWRGPRPAPAPASTVNRFSAPPAPAAETYVPLPARVIRISTADAPSAVRPSAPSAPAEPPAGPPSTALPAELGRIMSDRSRAALVEALVAAGWSTTQIRGQLRGANDAIGAEVEAARARLAERAVPPVVTPVAHRPTAAQFPSKRDPAG